MAEFYYKYHLVTTFVRQNAGGEPRLNQLIIVIK